MPLKREKGWGLFSEEAPSLEFLGRVSVMVRPQRALCVVYGIGAIWSIRRCPGWTGRAPQVEPHDTVSAGSGVTVS